MDKIKIELDIDKACWFDAVGGIDIPTIVGESGYVAHVQIRCDKDWANRIIEDLKQEAKNG